MLWVARRLKSANSQNDDALRSGGFLTRDSRMKERSKYGSWRSPEASSSPSDKLGGGEHRPHDCRNALVIHDPGDMLAGVVLFGDSSFNGVARDTEGGGKRGESTW